MLVFITSHNVNRFVNLNIFLKVFILLDIPLNNATIFLNLLRYDSPNTDCFSNLISKFCKVFSVKSTNVDLL